MPFEGGLVVGRSTVVGALLQWTNKALEKVEMRTWLKKHVTEGKHLQMFAEDAWLEPERQHPPWVYLPPSCSQSLMNNSSGNCCTSATIRLPPPSLLLHRKPGICRCSVHPCCPSGGQMLSHLNSKVFSGPTVSFQQMRKGWDLLLLSSANWGFGNNNMNNNLWRFPVRETKEQTKK